MLLGISTLFVALVISAVSAYYSVLGLTAIFSSVFWPIVIMGTALETGKVMTTLWLHKNWDRASWQYKAYLVPAMLFLMFLTSLGVYGYLSKAHLDQAIPSGDIVNQIALLDEKIKTSRDTIASSKTALAQMDSQLNELMSRSSSTGGAERAVQLRKQQTKERAQIQTEITAAQTAIATFTEQRLPIASQLQKAAAEVGPLKYIAALIYGDNPSEDVLEKSVRWVIILIVSVFDPLAIVLILAATKQLDWAAEDKKRAKEALVAVPSASVIEPNIAPIAEHTIDPANVTQVVEPDIHPIRTEADYEAALKIVSDLIDLDPQRDTPDGDRLEIMGSMVKAYESEHHPIDQPDPTAGILLAAVHQRDSKINQLEDDLVVLADRIEELVVQNSAMAIHIDSSVPTYNPPIINAAVDVMPEVVADVGTVIAEVEPVEEPPEVDIEPEVSKNRRPGDLSPAADHDPEQQRIADLVAKLMSGNCSIDDLTPADQDRATEYLSGK